MPRRIPRDEAILRIRAEGDVTPCLMCAIRDGAIGPKHVVYEDESLLVVLPRYATRWGHAIVLPRDHVTTFAEVTLELWAHTNAIAHRCARMIEAELRPLRCYVASMGAPGEEQPNTSMHLHVHVVPITDPDDRPRTVFSWEDGVLIAEPAEWEALRARYAAAFR